MKKILLLLSIITAFSACKKDDNNPNPDNTDDTTSVDSTANYARIVCKPLTEKITYKGLVFTNTYYYNSGDSLDSIMFNAGSEVGTPRYEFGGVYDDGSKSRFFTDIHSAYELWVISNKYDEITSFKLYNLADQLTLYSYENSYKINAVNTTKRKKYCRPKTTQYGFLYTPPSTNLPTAEYFYTNNQLDSTRIGNTTIKYSSYGANKIKGAIYVDGILQDDYTIEEYNEYNRPLSIIKYDKNNILIESREYTYDCK